MYIALTILHVVVCLFLVIVVLLQSGKAADLAGAFGGMGSQTAFGPRGSATVLSRATTVAAAVFMVTSLTLAVMAARGTGSSKTILETTKQPATTQQNKPGGIKVTTQGPGGPTTTTVPIPVNPAGQPPAAPPAPAKK